MRIAVDENGVLPASASGDQRVHHGQPSRARFAQLDGGAGDRCVHRAAGRQVARVGGDGALDFAPIWDSLDEAPPQLDSEMISDSPWNRRPRTRTVGARG